jgi:hypothetical protein
VTGRPQDPAGSRPRHDPDELRPSGEGPLLSDPDAIDEIVEAEAFDEGLEERIDARLASTLLPERVEPGEQEAVEVSSGPGPPPHEARFQFFTGALLAIGVVAVFLLGGFLLGVRDERKPEAGQSWSAWQPSKDGADGAEQIAEHIGPQYRGPDGRQLVLVEGGGLEVSGLPLTVAMRGSESAGGDIKLYEDEGVLYRLCGLGKDCAIATGKPSIQRHLLLRREALELALYSFRYLDDVKEVVVFMPPKLGDQPSQALFFRKNQVMNELEKPLEATLVDRTPTVARVTKSPDALLVEQLTIPTLFRFSLTQANQDDRAFLVLDPFDSAAPAEPQTRKQGSGRSNASTGG